jgi:predicted unusual protein kinase regulating ubiquinone biosynthesis (AarF/ABC1/UbiB family)
MFVLSDKFIYLMRSLSMVEGSCRQLYPDFNYKDFVDVLLPYIRVRDNDFMQMFVDVFRDTAALPKMVQNISEGMEDSHEFRKEVDNSLLGMLRFQIAITVMSIMYVFLHS